MKLRNFLYNTSKKMDKISNWLGDIESISSGNPKKIAKHFVNKAKRKTIYKTANKISRKITK